ncbi:MAG: molybdopterin molybdotransferase MoeA [Flavobacteriaceae bacterium]|nr:molybdopterin molybdotransferase MoeA [Flavobacteriaceae bacterium]
MITYKEAMQAVLNQACRYGEELVFLKDAGGRVLAENIYADRDFPPFDRATKDGIAIRFESFQGGRKDFEIESVVPAGEPLTALRETEHCVEIMTGAVVPMDTDTVVMYEEVDIAHQVATLKTNPVKGQNIHRRGSDLKKGDILITENSRITPAEIGILASVGCEQVKVRKLPKVAIISTGNELVEVGQTPLPHQIRKSNAHTLYTALKNEGITPLLLHVYDDVDMIRQKLQYAIEEMDVLLLSGGVSKGKYDFIPGIMKDLGVEKIFHRVLQQPGKPFWFGSRKASNTQVFSFPGNPVSTFVNYHLYFKNWLRLSLGVPGEELEVVLAENMDIKGTLTKFIQVKTYWDSGCLKARVVHGNGSGDLASLAQTDGFICLEPREEEYKQGTAVRFVPTRSLY